jgi:hypothetical protein
MSGVASPPPANGAPSAALADHLFALVKFVQSEDAQSRLKELKEAEARAIAQGDAALKAMIAAKRRTATLQSQVAAHDAAIEDFRSQSSDIQERLTLRTEALVAREAAVLKREDCCTNIEREHAIMIAAAESEAALREARLTQRERELDARIKSHDDERASFERRRIALEQAMRS